jgi:hypothetical protein
MVTTGVLLALAATPAMAQLAGSGNLINTSPSPPTGPSSSHQSTTIVSGGGGTRGVIYGVNGGDLAPGVNTSNLVVDPSQVRNKTANRSVGAYVEAGGAQSNGGQVTNGVTVRAAVSNGLGAGPTSVYRSADLNVPGNVGSAAGAGNLAGLGNTAGSGTVKNLTGNLTGNLGK